MYKKFLTVILILGIMSSKVLVSCAPAPGVNYSADGYSLNTYVSVTLYGCGSQRIADEAVRLCGYYEEIFSRTSPTSRLYALNERGSLDVEDVEDGLLADVVEKSLEYGDMTGGALDITVEPLTSLWDFGAEDNSVPGQDKIEDALECVDYRRVEADGEKIELNGARLDLGAVAKGYIADRIKEYLVGEGVDSALIYLGGNILCIGCKPDDKDFVVGIQRPFGGTDDVICAVRASGLSVVTSGVYERFFYEDNVLYHHILNPDTGFPCDNGLLSVTIIAEDSMLCDALSTACFVMGLDKAMELVDRLFGVYAVFVDENYNVVYSDGAEAFVLDL